MNPRVKQLAEQAGGMVLAGSEIEKFAELIVKECVGVAVDSGCGDFVDIEHLLLKHFGVEE